MVENDHQFAGAQEDKKVTQYFRHLSHNCGELCGSGFYILEIEILELSLFFCGLLPWFSLYSSRCSQILRVMPKQRVASE